MKAFRELQICWPVRFLRRAPAGSNDGLPIEDGLHLGALAAGDSYG